MTQEAVHIWSMHMQVRGAGSKSGTFEKAAQEAHAVRTLAEVTYQDERFRVPPGLLSTPQGAFFGATPHMLAFQMQETVPRNLGSVRTAPDSETPASNRESALSMPAFRDRGGRLHDVAAMCRYGICERNEAKKDWHRCTATQCRAGGHPLDGEHGRMPSKA